jgi:hypothetical protein
MLNLEPLYYDALASLEDGGGSASVHALPAAVHLMQRDVLNSYRYALDHYLVVDLDAPFLQRSSIGSPYAKWAKFANEDFSALSFAIGNLLRYTARLVHDTIAASQHASGQFSVSKRSSSRYIGAIVGCRRGAAAGLRCEDDERLCIKTLVFDDLDSSLETQNILDIGGARRMELLQRIHAEGSTELEQLSEMHDRFASLCRLYYNEHNVIGAFDEPAPQYLL